MYVKVWCHLSPVSVCVCVRACVRVCVLACVCVVCACLFGRESEYV